MCIYTKNSPIYLTLKTQNLKLCFPPGVPEVVPAIHVATVSKKTKYK